MKKFVRKDKGDSGTSRGRSRDSFSGRGGPSRGGDRGGFSGRGSRDSSSSRGGYSDRGSKRGSTNRRDFEMTEVTCSACKAKCEVPFKPTSDKPVYCSDCFGKQDKGGSNQSSNKGLEIINEKLDKIIKILEK